MVVIFIVMECTSIKDSDALDVSEKTGEKEAEHAEVASA